MSDQTAVVVELTEEEKQQAIEAVKGGLGGGLEENKIKYTMVCRFCIARKYNVEAASTMLSDFITWRKEYGVANLTLETPTVKSEAATMKGYFLGYTKTNQPLIMVHGGGHDPAVSPVSSVKDFALFMLEFAISHMPPGIEKFTLISDYSTFGYANLDNALLQEGATILQAYYPERLGDIYLTNYPFIMWGIWKVVSLWVDEKTRTKFHFVDNLDDLFEIADPSIIPDFLGGDFSGHYPIDGQAGTQRLNK